jgi:DNA-binding MarR family transcriptional regulator
MMRRDRIEEFLKECLFFTVKKLDRILDKLAEESFRSTGLSPTYGFIILAVHEKPGISQKELAELLHTAPSTITRFVEKLQFKGLLYSEQSGKHSLLYVTEEGVAMLVKINEAWDDLYRKYADIVGEDEGDELAKQIDDIGDQLSKMNRNR